MKKKPCKVTRTKKFTKKSKIKIKTKTYKKMKQTRK